GSFPVMTGLFLATAIATSVTGFAFPIHGVTPGIIVGILALVVLAIVLVAFYQFHVARSWRWIYAVGMVVSLYLLVFVGVAQAFQKIGFLNKLAPTQSELPFAIVQAATLILFAVVGFFVVWNYRPDAADAGDTGVRV
ncbi:MAG: hypothetical protein JWL62_3501, partial [Hyphomicrobiales bacterium]|nr:hypothetical protein [Hyphomicrobiales bacterium]